MRRLPTVGKAWVAFIGTHCCFVEAAQCLTLFPLFATVMSVCLAPTMLAASYVTCLQGITSITQHFRPHIQPRTVVILDAPMRVPPPVRPCGILPLESFRERHGAWGSRQRKFLPSFRGQSLSNLNTRLTGEPPTSEPGTFGYSSHCFRPGVGAQGRAEV